MEEITCLYRPYKNLRHAWTFADMIECGKMDGKITEGFEIPDWCPLPDAEKENKE